MARRPSPAASATQLPAISVDGQRRRVLRRPANDRAGQQRHFDARLGNQQQHSNCGNSQIRTSPLSANVVTFQNGINLNGGNRTIQVDDNPTTGGDYAVISGVISNGTGTYGIQKTGNGLLMLSGTNTYSGTTTISACALQADSGWASPPRASSAFMTACCKATARRIHRSLGAAERVSVDGRRRRLLRRRGTDDRQRRRP